MHSGKRFTNYVLTRPWFSNIFGLLVSGSLLVKYMQKLRLHIISSRLDKLGVRVASKQRQEDTYTCKFCLFININCSAAYQNLRRKYNVYRRVFYIQHPFPMPLNFSPSNVGNLSLLRNQSHIKCKENNNSYSYKSSYNSDINGSIHNYQDIRNGYR